MRELTNIGRFAALSVRFIAFDHDTSTGEIEKTLTFIRRLKQLHPTCEIILYFYSPTPQVDRAALRNDPKGAHLPVLKAYGPSGPALPATTSSWRTASVPFGSSRKRFM